MTGTLSFYSTKLGNCIGSFSILLFCPLVGSAPMVGSVFWTAEEILLFRLILFGSKPIFVLHMQRIIIRLFTFIREKEFSILAVQITASAL